MLQEMRKYAKSWVSSIFLGALALSFAIWGIADIFRGSSDTTVFSVGSTQLPVEAYSRDFHNQMRNAGVVLPPDQAKLLGQQVLEHMMLTTALDNLAGELGLTASDARVRQQIQAMPVFNGALGTFDHDVFLNAIGRAGYSENEFVETSRKDAARGQMLKAVEGGFSMPSDYARAIFSFINEQRAAQYVVLTPASLGDIPPPSEAELATYVKAHPERFSTPEYRSVSLAAIGVDDLASAITVTDKQVQDELDLHKTDYVVPEKRDLEQIQYATQAEAAAAKAEFDGGKSFDTLATEHKLKPADYKLGSVVAEDLDPARSKAFFALPANGVSAPVKSTFGWVLMHVAKITPGTSKTKDEIRLIVQRQLALAKMTDMANAFTDDLGGGDTIDEGARKAGMHFVRVAAVDAQGLAPDGSKVAATANPELLAAIFKADVGEDGDPFATQDGHYYAIKVDGVTPPKAKTLDQVRAQALASWMAERRAALLQAKAAALSAKANADHSLAGVAASLGTAVQSSPALNRGTNSGVFDANLVRAIYAAPAGGTVFSRSADGSFVVARVSGIAHPQPPEFDIGYLRGVSALSGEISSDITLSLAKAVEQRDGTKVNQKMIDQTVGNSGTGS